MFLTFRLSSRARLLLARVRALERHVARQIHHGYYDRADDVAHVISFPVVQLSFRLKRRAGAEEIEKRLGFGSRIPDRFSDTA